MSTMRAITYARLGDPSVLELVERPIPEPEGASCASA